MTKRIKLHPSNYLYFGLIATLLFIGIGGPAIGIYQYLTTSAGISIIIFFIAISMPFVISFFISDLKQWLSTIYITDSYIKISEIFKKPKIMEYTEYNHISYGFACVRGILEWFIIISNRKMSRFELENLNKIKKSDDFIKIKYSKKRREQLCEILPENMACQLKKPPQGKK